MKLKHHLWIAFGVVIVALFLTSIISNTEVSTPAIVSESKTSIWNLMYENLLTKIPTNEVLATLMGAPFGLPETMALDLIKEHGTGNSVLSGLLGLLPILATIGGVLLVSFKANAKKYWLYGSFGLIFVSVWTLWFTAPSKLNGVESMYNALSAPSPLGTMMKEGTVISMGLGFFVILAGSIYGIVALVLNQYGKIQE